MTSNLKLGIIAGGQLAKMLVQAASKWDVKTYVLDKDSNCPAGQIASKFIEGSNLDFEDVYQFGKQVDILTFEIEHVNIEALEKLQEEGVKILPDPAVLALIQDKGLQKQFYDKHNIPTAPFTLYKSDTEIKEQVEKGVIMFPFVQKLRKGGYDGRGVAVINNASDFDKLLPGPSVIEPKVSIAKEISVIVARNGAGDVKCHPVAEMVFDPTANLVDKLICPSEVTPEQANKAQEIACKIITLLQMEGLLAIEFFIDQEGSVIVNEMAPRTHNSGHHTIESNMTSQFEQHLRAVLSLPLGSTSLRHPSVMLNILGHKDYEGEALYEGLSESLQIEGVKIHLYGKKITKPYRKMGHVTIIASTLEEAVERAQKVKQLIQVKA